MKNYLILLFFISFSETIVSQKIIECSQGYSTMLVFESDIDRHRLGNNDVYTVVADTSESVSKVRTLEIKGNDKSLKEVTNLSVFTLDGNVYDFRLHYKSEPEKTMHFISVEESSGNMGAIKTKGKKKTSENEVVRSPVSHFSNGVVTEKGGDIIEKITYSKEEIQSRIKAKCNANPAVTKSIGRVFKNIDNITLRLKQVTYDEDEIYLHLSLENTGGLAYEIDNMIFSISDFTKKSGAKKSSTIVPLYKHNEPNRLNGFSKADFIVVFEKFTITDKDEIEIDIAEKNGGRILKLSIKNKFLSNPIKL